MKISFCGIDCDECEAYIATKNNDNTLRQNVAQKWSEQFSVSIPPENINCMGCKSDGVKVYYCEKMCKVRKCASEKKLENCAHCSDYACDDLNEIFSHGPQIKETLDNIKKTI